MADPIASDGLPAFELYPWTRRKLFLIERYLGIFTTAMRRRWALTYADLFAGPGLCVDPRTGEEMLGSPLLALRSQHFMKMYLNDLDPEMSSALRTRVGDVDPDVVKISELDCNVAAHEARDYLFPSDFAAQTRLGLVVLDPRAFQISFDSIKELTADLRIDLIIIFMTGFVRRFISQASYADVLDRFMGTDEWRRLAPGIEREEPFTYRALLDLYEEQLKSIGYTTFDDRSQARNRVGANIYHIVFASKHKRGGEFWEKISLRDESGGQRLL